MKKLGISVILCALGSSVSARAAVPSGYTGTPFQGTPAALPGRIEFENFDEGGKNISWRVDDSTANFGQDGCAGNAYRTGEHPQICQTNTSAGENDVFSLGPMQGMHYPSEAMPMSMYLGYTHPADWVKLTVNVTQAGKYQLSSTWASEPGGAGGIHFQILFNDALKADVTLTGTGGYHNWVEFPDFATVDLEAGLQVLQFAPKSYHLNYDYLQLSLMLPGGGLDDGHAGGTSAGGASNSAGATNAGATAIGGGGAGGSSSGGAPSSAGSAGSDQPTNSAGMPGSAGQVGSNGGAASGGATSTKASSDATTSGCSCRLTASHPTRRPWFVFALGAALACVLRRRRRRA